MKENKEEEQPIQLETKDDQTRGSKTQMEKKPKNESFMRIGTLDSVIFSVLVIIVDSIFDLTVNVMNHKTRILLILTVC